MKWNGSSETLREATFKCHNFDFSAFLQENPYKKQSQHFYEWFLGFAEGDGAILSSWSTDKRRSNAKPLQRLMFFIVQQDPTVLYEIKKKLGFGTVEAHGEYFRYRVADKKHIRLLCLLFNGNLCLEMREKQLEVWCVYLDIALCLRKNYPVLLDTAWLSGFTDAEGCFTISTKKDQRYKTGTYIRYAFYLDQSDELDALAWMQHNLGGKIYFRKGTRNCSRLTVGKVDDFQDVLIPYFTRYNLRTKKHVTFLKVKKIYDQRAKNT